jgi:RHS repeat-associated protein
MGGLLMLNPGGITFPAAKMLDMVIGLDNHTTLPAPIPPPAGPLPPLPLFPAPFAGPILLSVQPTVLVNFMPAAGSGAVAIGFHMPPLPWPWPPITFGAILKSAIMAVVQAPFMALLELARGQLSGLAAGSTNPVLKNGFVQGFLGQPPGGGGQGGSDITIGRFFPMFGSPQAFLGFLAQCMPLPVANGQATIASPTVSACDSPMALAMPMGGNSCSEIPIVPNASVLGFSNVLTGMSLSQLLGVMAWNAASAAAAQGLKKGSEAAENGVARAIKNSNNPRLQNVAQKVSDFTGSKHCMAEGHPVDVASGTVFNTQTDFELHGPHPLPFARTYNSKATEALRADDFDFGPGWRHGLEESLIADADAAGNRSLGLRDFEGRILGFAHPAEDTQQSFHPLDRLVMTRVDGRTFSVEGVDRVRRVFRFPGGEADKAPPAGYLPGVGAVARLVEITAPGGRSVQLEYNAETGRLARVHDAHLRTVAFERDRAGRIVGATLVRSAGRECNVFLAAYRYDADGRLLEHTDRNRNVRRYTYDTRGRMIKETDRCGYSFHFVYDEADRCIRTHGDDNAYWVELDYQPGGGVTTATDAFGGKTVYKYDPRMLVTEILDAEGGVTKREYSEEGWLCAVTSPAGRCTETAYDARGREVARVDGLGNKETWQYDHGGWPVVFTDACGKKWLTTWDAHGRRETETTPSGAMTRYEYDAAGHLSRAVGADGSTWRYAHRTDGLLERIDRPDGCARTFGYDPFGQVTRTIETPSGGGDPIETTYQRDAAGRLTGVDRPEGRVERSELDGEGRPIKRRTGQRVSTLRYNGMGKIVEHVDGLGRTTRLTYDLHQHPLTLVAPGERRWTWTRDKLGRVTRMSRPGGARVGYAYDGDGNLLQLRTADGRVVTRTWDAAGNLTAIEWPDRTKSRFKYDASNRMIEAESDGDRPVRRAFDVDGHLSMEQQGDEWLRFAYDPNGRRSRRTTSWGDEVRTAWTGTGRLTRLDDAQGGQHRFFTDAFGRRQAWHAPGKVRGETQYDAAHRVIESQLRDALGQMLHQRVLTWDANDTLSSVQALDAPGGRRQTIRYDRDPAGRLIGEAHDQEAPRAYTHDAADNLLTTPEGDAYTYDTEGRLVADGAGHAYRHDVGGRLVVVDGAGGKRTLWYDARDRLQRVHTETGGLVVYEYDALGRRARTVAESDGRVDEEVLYWDGDQLARRVTRALTVTDVTRDEHYVWDLERNAPLARFVLDARGRRRQTYVVDHRGAAVALTDDAGAQVWHGRYDSYGRCTESGTESGSQPVRLMGQVHEGATGYAHHRYRVFDPATRRFLTLDPVGLLGGLNPYAYPSDPVTFADPLGLAKCSTTPTDAETTSGPRIVEHPSQRAARRAAEREAGMGRNGGRQQLPDQPLHPGSQSPEGPRGVRTEVQSTDTGRIVHHDPFGNHFADNPSQSVGPHYGVEGPGIDGTTHHVYPTTHDTSLNR